MQGLLMRLSSLDDRAENAMRVIGFFDALIEQRSDLQTVLSQAGRFAECSVGIAEPGATLSMVGTRTGVLEQGTVPDDAMARVLSSGHTVWIARSGQQAFPLDEVVLERFGLACIAASGSSMPLDLHLGDPALLELILGRLASSADRSRAIQLLGITPSTPVTMLAVHGDLGVAARVVAHLRPRAWTRIAQIGDLTAIATTTQPARDLGVPREIRVGVSLAVPAVEARRAWQGAINGLRLAADTPAGENVVFQADLGPYELLAAKLRAEDIADVGDVQALERLDETPAGRNALQTVEVLLRAGSLREAARQLHLHHNSVAARVSRAEAELDYSITTPLGMTRVTLALALRRLGQNNYLV